MQDLPETTPANGPPPNGRSGWPVISWLCAGVIVASLVACLILAGSRSRGLTGVTVTALETTDEPRDHNLPLVKQKEALPDYEVHVMLSDGGKIDLGAKPDTPAVGGLTWELSEPVSVADVTSIRLQEQDKMISDAVAEVQLSRESTTDHGYRFEFRSERSLAVGIQSFFRTPIGQAIVAGFCLAIVVMLADKFSWIT